MGAGAKSLDVELGIWRARYTSGDAMTYAFLVSCVFCLDCRTQHLWFVVFIVQAVWSVHVEFQALSAAV
jgi:hypothetical protein